MGALAEPLAMPMDGLAEPLASQIDGLDPASRNDLGNEDYQPWVMESLPRCRAEATLAVPWPTR